VEALLRRTRPAQWAQKVYDDGLLRVDPTARLVLVNDQEVALTPTEYRLISMLVRHAGATLSTNQLLAEAWEDPTGIGAERVKFTVLRLRRKLGWNDAKSSPIESVRGVGYRYRPPDGDRSRPHSRTVGHVGR
jgi:DNA-binding response OmpR family regulator